MYYLSEETNTWHRRWSMHGFSRSVRFAIFSFIPKCNIWNFSGILCVVPVSMYASEIVNDFSNQHHSDIVYTFGPALYVGWVSSVSFRDGVILIIQFINSDNVTNRAYRWSLECYSLYVQEIRKTQTTRKIALKVYTYDCAFVQCHWLMNGCWRRIAV